MDYPLRTEFIPPKHAGKVIDFSTPLLLTGSCFSDDVGQRMVDAGFNALCNPLGTLYNPMSIARSLGMARNGQEVTEDELVESQGSWHHLMFHSSFSSLSKSQAVAKMNAALERTRYFLTLNPLIVITLGTSYGFFLPDGTVVGNCHKLPSSAFTRRLLSMDEIAQSLEQIKPDMITVSPVRHLADTLPGNSLSKAQLIVAANQYVNNHVDSLYFPSFEIVNDDLRDYRFYARDMVHPSEVACDYVFQAFLSTFCVPQVREQARKNMKKAKSQAHRTLIP